MSNLILLCLFAIQCWKALELLYSSWKDSVSLVYLIKFSFRMKLWLTVESSLKLPRSVEWPLEEMGCTAKLWSWLGRISSCCVMYSVQNLVLGWFGQKENKISKFALEVLIYPFFHSASMLLLGRGSWDGAETTSQVVKMDCVYVMFK